MATENTRLLSQNGNGQPGRTREEYLELGDADRMAESQLCQCCCTDCGKYVFVVLNDYWLIFIDL